MSENERRPLVGGNWKMHLLASEAGDWCGRLLELLDASPGSALPAEVVIFPSHPLVPAVAAALGEGPIACGGQDLHPLEKGAHTGDVSGAQLRDAGCAWVLCGHSERRRDHGEDDTLVGRKVAAATAAGLVPLLCVGETREERRAGRTFEVLERQLGGALASRPHRWALAYEPVWAIGTGETATPDIAQGAHRFLREAIADLEGAEAAAARRILYGGSVNPDNAATLIAQPDLDGFLVGGASLDPESFSAIIRSCGQPG